MIRVFSHDNILQVYNVKNVLSLAGIDCVIRNDLIHSAAGELPPTEVWPEVWITNKTELERARSLVDEVIHGDARAVSWACPSCGETNAPAFELCWQCATERPVYDET